MIDLAKLTIFNLAKGAHETPDKGLCFMEAVAWMAGEPHSDYPECVCPVIASYGRALNDVLPHAERQRLVPLIATALGSRGTPEIEASRRSYIALRAAREIVPLSLDAAATRAKGGHKARLIAAARALRAMPDETPLEDIRLLCDAARAAADDAAAYDAANAAYAAVLAANAANAGLAAYAAYAVAPAAYAAAYDAANAAYAAVLAAANAAYAAVLAAANAAYAAYAVAPAADAAGAYATNARTQVYTVAINILDGAIRLGPHSGWGAAAARFDERIAAARALAAA